MILKLQLLENLPHLRPRSKCLLGTRERGSSPLLDPLEVVLTFDVLHQAAF